MTNSTIDNSIITTESNLTRLKTDEYSANEGSEYFTCNYPSQETENKNVTTITSIGIATKRTVSEIEKNNIHSNEISPISNPTPSTSKDTTPTEAAQPVLKKDTTIATARTRIKSFVPEVPEWNKNKKAWAFLQSLNPKYESKYLERQGVEGQKSTAYLFGRDPSCDFIFNQTEVSRRHCYIYMERGCSDVYGRGISIYLEDISSNGTYINGAQLQSKERILLRSGDRIQLYRREAFADNDLRHSFYRVIFPPTFEVIPFHSEYHVVKQIGRGNFATVYKGYHRSYKNNEIPETERKYVAAKVISKSKFQKKPKLLPSVIQEIGILMSLEVHPCVIQIEKVFDETKYIYLVLEYIQEGDLFDYVSQNRFLTEEATRFIFFQLFSGIEFLHQRGVVHRDLKPENVLMVDTANLRIKITDFGLATHIIGKDLLETQCGTPNYVAPEILNPPSSRSYGKPCDLWSLGVMLYICLCGFPPFNEDSAPPSMKQQIMEGIYSFTSPYWDNISDEAKDLVSRLLTVDPKERININDAKNHSWMNLDGDTLQQRLDQLSPSDKSLFNHYETRCSLEPTQPI
ncbi:unnamed protein product [Cunninghamella echinulata]